MLKKLFFAKNRPHFSLFLSRIQFLFFMFFAVKPRWNQGSSHFGVLIIRIFKRTLYRV